MCVCVWRERKRDEKSERGQEGPRQGYQAQKIKCLNFQKSAFEKKVEQIQKIYKLLLVQNYFNYYSKRSIIGEMAKLFYFETTKWRPWSWEN